MEEEQSDGGDKLKPEKVTTKPLYNYHILIKMFKKIKNKLHTFKVQCHGIYIHISKGSKRRNRTTASPKHSSANIKFCHNVGSCGCGQSHHCGLAICGPHGLSL
jgi:hypothetical protein